MAKTPQWATDLVQQVALDEGRIDLPLLMWRRKSYGFYAGGTEYSLENKIVISVGK